MHAITASHLRNAHGGESMAHMRYEIWAQKAEEDGFPNIARLFRAISYAETIHAKNHFNVLKEQFGDTPCNSMAVFGLGSTSQNLQGGIMGENFEIEEMYPTYLETAKYQNEGGAQRSFHYALSAEKIHRAMFVKAKETVDSSEKDISLKPVGICNVCGWTQEGDLPDKCPICGASRSQFKIFS
ncbi:MAG: rubrerythrin family protein [Dehalococcoidales bacterium]|nr:rubrerythrin family protein [Dehalococcoidales bacterium]